MLEVDIKIDAKAPVNAIEAEISFPKDQLEFVSSDNTGSVVDIWQAQPKLLPSGGVALSGGMFRPFTGEGGQVIKLNFRVLSGDGAKIIFTKESIYMADGKATLVEGDEARLFLTTSYVNNSQTSDVKEEDATPPSLKLNLITNPALGERLVSFYAYDPESGIRNTEMRIRRWFFYGEWTGVDNPVPEPSGAWQMEVRAINNQGLASVRSVISAYNLLLKILALILAAGVLYG